MEVSEEPAPGIDLTPRAAVPTAARGKKKPWFAYAVLVLVLAAGGVFVFNFLTNAIDYYCNVDEIGTKDGCDVDRNIRIQGVVDKDSVSQEGSVTSFVITFNGASMPVILGSKPTGLFQECIPVVVTGKVIEDDNGDRFFEGDEVLVKHSEEYDAENKDRVATANGEAEACSQKD
ncbi:MAG: cytochrome c maturation protein CcmE [Actinomycetota bacterium]|nr:cytochrome c maturation protein CcmE [Actinomycetota bacterium]